MLFALEVALIYADEMELRQMEHFLEVAKEMNISRAAQNLYLTQPALSRQMRALEEDLGVELFDRGAHSIKLTGVGELFQKEAREILARVDLAVSRVKRMGGATVLRVGYSPSLALDLLIRALGSLSRLYPKVKVEMNDMSSSQMLEGLLEGRLDLVLMVKPSNAPREISWVELQQQEWRLAVGKSHPLCGEELEVVDASQLSGHKLLLFAKEEYPDYWREITGWAKEVGIQAKVGGEYDGVSSLMAAVEAGLGVALVSEGTAGFVRNQAVIKQIDPMPRNIGIYAGFLEARQEESWIATLLEELKSASHVIGAI